MQKKSLVKRVFNFGSVHQDLGVTNQIAERCLHHGLYKDCDTNLKGLRERERASPSGIQPAIDEATHPLGVGLACLKIRQGEKLSCAYTN